MRAKNHDNFINFIYLLILFTIKKIWYSSSHSYLTWSTHSIWQSPKHSKKANRICQLINLWRYTPPHLVSYLTPAINNSRLTMIIIWFTISHQALSRNIQKNSTCCPSHCDIRKGNKPSPPDCNYPCDISISGSPHYKTYISQLASVLSIRRY
jgi:hypothetical protein